MIPREVGRGVGVLPGPLPGLGSPSGRYAGGGDRGFPLQRKVSGTRRRSPLHSAVNRFGDVFTQV